jgi:hypothetical protein
VRLLTQLMLYIFTCNVQEVDHFVSEYDLTLHVYGIVLDKVDLVYHGLAKLWNGIGSQIASLLSKTLKNIFNLAFLFVLNISSNSDLGHVYSLKYFSYRLLHITRVLYAISGISRGCQLQSCQQVNFIYLDTIFILNISCRKIALIHEWL